MTVHWIKETQLIHTDNIALDHNPPLLHTFTQDIYHKNTLTTYESCINFSQSKRPVLHPTPIETMYLTLNIKECS